ncbi:MAG: hypothetical protein GY861_13935 [bacterium]|nr:hypothetical protein [bacterium]
MKTEEQLREEAEAKAKADAEAKKTADADELLKSLKLKDTEIETLKGNDNLLGILTHSLDAKRAANAEAKKNREALETLQSEAEKAKKEKLEKKGEFEKLYQEANEKLTAKDLKLKDALIKGELSRLSGLNGLAKAEYLKLLDTSSIEVDLETLKVTGAEDVFTAFKESSPELFGKQHIPGTDTGQGKISQGPTGDLDKLKKLEATARTTGMPRDLAQYMSLKRELEAKGKL